MNPYLNHLVVQAHINDLYRDVQRSRTRPRHGRLEARVRQMIRRAPPRRVTRRTRQVPVASRH